MTRSPLPRPARLYLVAHAVSVAGFGAQVVTFALLALQQYSSASVLAGMVVARSVGLLVATPVAGWGAARFGALRVAACCHVVFAASAVAVGAIAVSGSPPHWLFGAAAVLGVAMAIDAPARRGGAADLAGPDGVVAVQAWSATAVQLGRVAGAVIGALCWAVAPWSAFVFNAVSYLGPALVFFWFRAESPPLTVSPRRPAPLAGLRALGAVRGARGVLAATAVGGAAVEFGVLLPLVVVTFGLGAVTLSGFELVVGVGAALAGVVGARVGADRLALSAWGWWVASGSGGLFAVPSWPVVAVGVFGFAFGVTLASSSATAVLCATDPQRRADALTAQASLQWVSAAVAAVWFVAAASHGFVVLAAGVVGCCAVAGWLSSPRRPHLVPTAPSS